MNMNSRHRRVTVLSVAAVMALACAGSSIAMAASSRSAGVANVTAKTRGSLTGSWSGQYGGAFSGTFTLHWTQSGSRLHGTITISNPHSNLAVNGALRGSAITFGTVGGPGITYTGSASGTSMSGSYSTPKGGGPWSAHKT
jgi:hypothetical protein